MTEGRPEPRQDTVRSIGRHGFHDIAYLDWGDPAAAEVTFCVHGLSRNSHDFDPLARVLAARRRVICPDLAGRGGSDWLKDPADYNMLQYNLDLTVLAARIAERLETREKANDVQRRMLEAAARRPCDLHELAERLRDGRF